ncbi:hypothetical protein GCM10023231_28420 [Olivibacter ginsenosidimutans]|uniref:DUF4168 domain-containing protein n=1 Tax=Olivibacter ginsenosidimutans TaxID=1176537 RepID=A0ABP9BNS6_9SPHI
MKTFKRISETYNVVLGISAFLIVVCSNSTAFGQTTPQTPPATQTAPTQAAPVKEDFEEKELDRFLNANQKINAIQTEAQGEMVKIIEKEGMTVEKFNTMAQAQQTQDSTASKQDPKDIEAFQKVAQQINGMQQGLEGKMTKAVEEEGLNVETYVQIAQAYQQSPKVKNTLDEKMKKKQAETTPPSN